MLIGLLYAGLSLACGLAVQRALRLTIAVAPLSGLAILAALTSWCAVLKAPPLVTAVLVYGLAITGIAASARGLPCGLAVVRSCRWPTILVASATVLPVLMLGTVLADIQAPVSTHDGAFHVETIDSLRRGLFVQTWYPVGFHTSVAATLDILPWLDSARGTLEAAEGLAILAPLAVFGVGLSLGADALLASIAAVFIALTWTYPYDYHLWGGWPQGMGVLLLAGLLCATVRWLARPSARWAVLGGVFAAAIVLSHGTEVYSAVLVLSMLAAMRWRCIDLHRLLRHLPLAVAVALLLVGPYLLTVIGWARAGAATSVGSAIADYAAANPEDMGRADWLQFVLGITGASSLLDVPIRSLLMAVGLRLRPLRLVSGLWLIFVVLLFLVDFFDWPPIRTVFVATYPWLVDHRPRQVAVIFASVLAAGGLTVALAWLGRFRLSQAGRPAIRRWSLIVTVLLIAFFAEGSAVSIYKRLTQVVDEQNVYVHDDDVAMAWLRQHAGPDEMLANDTFRDAGVWAPYKAGLPILLPRSGTPDAEARQAILPHLADMRVAAAARQKACEVRLTYVYVGAKSFPNDPPLIPDRALLDASPDLAKVFMSGDAAIYRLSQPCG